MAVRIARVAASTTGAASTVVAARCAWTPSETPIVATTPSSSLLIIATSRESF
jgi:hypothetical protein